MFIYKYKTKWPGVSRIMNQFETKYATKAGKKNLWFGVIDQNDGKPSIKN